MTLIENKFFVILDFFNFCLHLYCYIYKRFSRMYPSGLLQGISSRTLEPYTELLPRFFLFNSRHLLALTSWNDVQVLIIPALFLVSSKIKGIYHQPLSQKFRQLIIFFF